MTVRQLCLSQKKRRRCVLQVLLVSGSGKPDRWVVPGGGIEPAEDSSVAAVREVQEEAGVKGTIGRLLGVFEVRMCVCVCVCVCVCQCVCVCVRERERERERE